jgi:hypothetical protein
MEKFVVMHSKFFVKHVKFVGHLKDAAILRVLALAASLALLCVPALAQHEGHEMHQHPPQPSATPAKPKPQPQATPTPTPTASAMPMPMSMPAQSPAQPTAQSPAQMTMPTGHEGHAGHEGMSGGAGATKPAAEEAAKPSVNETAKPAAGTGRMDDSMPGMNHSSHAGDMAGMDHSAIGGGAGGLMVMSGAGMSVRVGASETNLMPMGQVGSGTSWQPASTPMYMWHWSKGEWLLMLHGEAKIGVNRQGGPLGVTKFESENWIMPMAYHKLGRGTLNLRAMFSAEPLTFSGAGSPQLFQAGEEYRGRPLVNFQHPHDLFMEMSATYTAPIGERATWFTYVGFPGEPALGPVAFMHRASASENPSAPLAHHLQDSTHISYGVFTSGFTYRWLKAEGSLFNGREPDEHRFNLEFNPWNSRSLRVTVAPNENWAVQYSYGFLKRPEQLEPGDTRRRTASVQYDRPFERGNLAAAFIWGRNRNEHNGITHQNGYTAEATVNFLDKNYIYTRLELVDREELLGHAELHQLGFDEGAHPQFRIGAYTFGAARDIRDTDGWSIAIGGDLTFYSKPQVLDALYGRNPTSYKLFLRIRPGKMKH